MGKLIDLCATVFICTVAYRLSNIVLDIATDRVASAIASGDKKAA